MRFSALSGPGHLHLTFSFSTSGHVEGKMHGWSLWSTSSLLFSCTQSCKGLQVCKIHTFDDDMLLHKEIQRNSLSAWSCTPQQTPWNPCIEHIILMPTKEDHITCCVQREQSWQENLARKLRPLLSGSNPHGLRWWSCQHTKSCGVFGSKEAKLYPSSTLSGDFSCECSWSLDLSLSSVQDSGFNMKFSMLRVAPSGAIHFAKNSSYSLQGFGFTWHTFQWHHWGILICCQSPMSRCRALAISSYKQ